MSNATHLLPHLGSHVQTDLCFEVLNGLTGFGVELAGEHPGGDSVKL